MRILDFSDGFTSETEPSGGLVTAVGTYAAPTSVTAAGGVAAPGATATITMAFISGSGGNVDITANPQIAAGAFIGQILILVQSGANRVKLEDGTGLKMNGFHDMPVDSAIVFIWLGATPGWCELARKDA